MVRIAAIATVMVSTLVIAAVLMSVANTLMASVANSTGLVR
jgi:hypothetical protein